MKIDVPIECNESGTLDKDEKGTYKNIKKYVYDKFGVNVHSGYIAQVKRSCGIEMGDCYHLSKSENYVAEQCIDVKREYIKEALQYFKAI